MATGPQIMPLANFVRVSHNTSMNDLVPIEALAGGNTDFGSAMRALNERQRKYVLVRVAQGTKNAAAAAELAGYSAVSYGSIKVQAHALEHNPKIQAAITEEALRQARHNLGSMLVRASERVGEVMENPQVAAGDTLKAAAMIFDRMGLHAVSEQKRTVEHIGDSPEVVEKIKRLAAQLGMDAGKLLGPRLNKRPVVTEAEYVEVRPNPLEGFL